MTAPNTNQRDAMERQTATGLVLPLPSPLLAMLPAMYQGLPMQWFIEPILISAVAPGLTGTGSWTTDKNHAHVSWYGSLKVRSSDNQTDRDADPATFLMTDTSNTVFSKPQFFNDIANVWGNAKQPAIWPAPLVIGPNSGITLTVVNQSNANTNNYNFAFMGVLITVP